MKPKNYWASIFTKDMLVGAFNAGSGCADIGKLFDVNLHTVYKYAKIHGVDHCPSGTFIKTCDCCNEQYEAIIKHGIGRRQRFCSSKCRTRYWQLQNPELYKQMVRKSVLKLHPIFCKHCGKKIEDKDRKAGKTICSVNCTKATRKIGSIKRRKKASKAFEEYKCNIGCQMCGYKQYGGSLDFHHIDPKQKDRRIGSTHLTSLSKISKSELDKCVLLCKNCHYYIHHIMRQDINAYNEIIYKITNEDQKCDENGEVFLPKEYNINVTPEGRENIISVNTPDMSVPDWLLKLIGDPNSGTCQGGCCPDGCRYKDGHV